MKKDQALLLLALLVLGIPAAWGQGATTRTSGAASLPSTCTPSGVNAAANSIIVNNVHYICTATNTWTAVRGLEADNTWTNNMRFTGPDPWADITAFGARATSPAVATVTCKGTTSITANLGSLWNNLGGFLPNDGINIYGCGPTVTVTAPTSISVKPSGTYGLANTESPLTVATGSTSYSYRVITRDIYGGLSAASSPVTISNGLPSLGKQTCTISTLSRTNDQITFTTTASCPLVVADLVHLEPTTNTEMGGWYNIAQVDSSTQFEIWQTAIDTRAQGWMAGDSTSSSGGGTVVYYRNNYIKWAPVMGAWEYYVCAKRTGLGDTNYHLIGVTKPTGPGSGYLDAAFEDYGSPYEDLQTYPTYVQTAAEATFNNNPTNISAHTTSNAVCTASSALNDPLSTWIVSSPDGGKTLIVHDAATQTLANTPAIFDDGAALRRAITAVSSGSPNFIGSVVYIPPTSYPYVINSYVSIPNSVSIYQAGRLLLNETVSAAAPINWWGDWSGQTGQQFGIGSGASIASQYANPNLFLDGGATLSNFRALTFSSTAPNGGVNVVDDSGSSTFNLVNFGTGGSSTDYVGMTYIARPVGSIQWHFFDKVSFSTGPDQVNDKSWTPSFWNAPAQNGSNDNEEITMRDVSWNRRGFAASGGSVASSTISGPSGFGLSVFTVDYSYRQGGIIPMFTYNGITGTSGSEINLNHVSQDTEGQPLFAQFTKFATSAPQGVRVSISDPNVFNSPLIGGLRPAFVDLHSGSYPNAFYLPNRDSLFKSGGSAYAQMSPYRLNGGIGPFYAVDVPMEGVGGYSWWMASGPPTSVTASAAAGGSVPVGTWYYAVSGVGADGGETIAGGPSSGATTSRGTQAVNVAWTGVIGLYSYNVYRCTVSCLTSDGLINTLAVWYQVATGVTGTSYSDTRTSPSSATMRQASGTGPTIMNATGLYSPFFLAPPITVSQLPAAAAGNAGQVRRVTDSTAITIEGQPCLGGSTNAALAFSNGTVWKCL